MVSTLPMGKEVIREIFLQAIGGLALSQLPRVGLAPLVEGIRKDRKIFDGLFEGNVPLNSGTPAQVVNFSE